MQERKEFPNSIEIELTRRSRDFIAKILDRVPDTLTQEGVVALLRSAYYLGVDSQRVTLETLEEYDRGFVRFTGGCKIC